jgi:RND family efflux transporter MFP subunit
MPLDQEALASLRRTGERSSPAGTRRFASRRRLWWFVAAALLVAGLLAWRYAAAPVTVQTATVDLPSGSADGAVLNASGYVVASRLATVSSKVTGRITDVLFEEGAKVEAGQVLARLDPATANAEHLVATRSLEAARRSLREIEVRLADARKTLERTRNLVGKRLLADSALDLAEADVAALQARLEAARAEVGVAEGQLGVSRQALEDLAVRAPFAGVVISKDAQPGETVSPVSAGGGFTRTGIATIVDMDSREIEVDVNEAYINRVRDEQRVEAVLDAYPDWRIPARVIGIVPTADRQKATVRVRIAFEALDPRILPDMGIKVRFLDDGSAATTRAVPTVPEAALLREDGVSSVWVVEDGRALRREVQAGEVSDGRVAVTAGLEAGQTVVVEPPPRLREGGRVQPKAE